MRAGVTVDLSATSCPVPHSFCTRGYFGLPWYRKSHDIILSTGGQLFGASTSLCKATSTLFMSAASGGAAGAGNPDTFTCPLDGLAQQQQHVMAATTSGDSAHTCVLPGR